MLYIRAPCYPIAWTSLCWFGIASAREALRPSGALERMGGGKVLLGTSKGRILRWRIGGCFFGSFFSLVGTTQLIRMFVFGKHPAGPNAQLTLYSYFQLGSLMLGIATAVPVIFIGWMASMQQGSALARLRVQAAIDAVKKSDPRDKVAFAPVAAQCLQLEHTMQELSDGWGRGLLGLTLWC